MAERGRRWLVTVYVFASPAHIFSWLVFGESVQTEKT